MLPKPKTLKSARRGKKAEEKEMLHMWEVLVKTRAGYKCEFPGCGKSADHYKLDAHHVFSKGTFHHLKFDPDNGLSLCVTHHQAGWGKEAAHSDPGFKDKILGKVPGYPPCRDEQWYLLLDRKAQTPQKLDLKLERLYLEQKLKELNITL